MFNIIIQLEKLRVEFNQNPLTEFAAVRKKMNDSGLERTAGLYRHRGAQCPFAIKSLSLFKSKDLSSISRLLKEASPKLHKKVFLDV